MSKPTIYYKIRHRTTGLYHKGTMRSSWDKAGKTWVTLGKLRTFISNYQKYSNTKSVTDFVVVELEIKEVSEKEVADIIDPKKLIEILSR